MTLRPLFPVTQQFQAKNGSNLVGGKVYIYYQGRTALATTYHDEEGTVVNPNPVLLDNNGRATVFADTIYSYTIVVCDYYGKELFSQDITLHDAISTAKDVIVIGSNGTVKVDTTTLPNGVKYDMSVNTDIIATKESVAKKKDKQTELAFDGSATKTVKSITQNANGELNVEFEDIDLPQKVPNVEITSEDKSIKVSETTDVQTNTKKFDLSVQGGGTTYSAGDAIDLTNNTISVKHGKGLEITTDNKLQLKVGEGLSLDNDTLDLAIKDLPTSITDFRTGDVIAVDGPSGTAKMSKSSLLRVTAENVAANAGNYSWKSDAIKSYLGFVGPGKNPTWGREDHNQSSHVTIPIQEGDVLKITAHTQSDGINGAFSFLTSSFTEGDQKKGTAVPIGSFLKRLRASNGQAYVEIAGASDKYLCLTTKDGPGNVVSWDVDVIRDNNHLHHVKTFTGTIGVGDETRYWSDWHIKAGDRYKVVVELDYDNFTLSDTSSVTLNTNSVHGDRASKVNLMFGYDDSKSVSFEKDFVATDYAECFYLAFPTPLSGTVSYKVIVYEVLDDVLDLPIKDGMSVTALSDETDKTFDFKLDLKQGLTYKFDFRLPMFIGKKLLVQVLDSSDNVVGTIYKKETKSYGKEFTDFHFIYTATADSVKCRVITNTFIGVDFSVKVTNTGNNFEGGYSYEGYKLDFFENQYRRNCVAHLSTYEGKAIQAMRFLGDRLFVFHHGGWCDVYDAYSFKKIGDLFKCPSTNETHATTATFGDVILAGQDFPLVYISKGKYLDSTDMVCDVCQIAYSKGVWSSSDVQKITLDQSGFAEAGLETMWGYPMFLPIGDKLYTIRSHYNDQDPVYLGKNYFVITEFNLPDTANASVTLTASDVLRQFTSPIDFILHQASQVRGNKLLTTYGDGGTSTGKPNGVRFQDFPSGKILTKIDLSDILTEIQTIDAFNGGVYVLFVDGTLYRFDF